MSGASLLLLFALDALSHAKKLFYYTSFDGSFLILTSWTGYEAEGGCKFYGRLIPF
jgi:hypothetical protein